MLGDEHRGCDFPFKARPQRFGGVEASGGCPNCIFRFSDLVFFGINDVLIWRNHWHIQSGTKRSLGGQLRRILRFFTKEARRKVKLDISRMRQIDGTSEKAAS